MCSTLILLVALVCVICECVRAVRAAIGILPSGTTNSDAVVTSPSYVDRSRSTNRQNIKRFTTSRIAYLSPHSLIWPYHRRGFRWYIIFLLLKRSMTPSSELTRGCIQLYTHAQVFDPGYLC